jgi:hypothetical protein
MDIRAFALKKRMLLDVQDHVKIARRPAECSSFAQSGEAYAGSVFDSGWNFGFDRPLPQNSSLPFALRTWVGDDTSNPLAGRASASHAEETLLVSDLSASGAGAARNRRLALGSARTPAVFAAFVAAAGDLCLFAEDRLFELQRNVFAQVGPTLGSSASPATRAKQIANPEEVAENFAEIDHRVGARRSSDSIDAGMAKTVVGGALIQIRKNGVGLAALFEFLFGVGVIRVAVRVKLQRQFAIGALDFLLASSASNPEDLVVIAFYVAGQNRIFAFLRNISVSVWNCGRPGPSPAARADPSTCIRVATRQ